MKAKPIIYLRNALSVTSEKMGDISAYEVRISREFVKKLEAEFQEENITGDEFILVVAGTKHGRKPPKRRLRDKDSDECYQFGQIFSCGGEYRS